MMWKICPYFHSSLQCTHGYRADAGKGYGNTLNRSHNLTGELLADCVFTYIMV